MTSYRVEKHTMHALSKRAGEVVYYAREEGPTYSSGIATCESEEVAILGIEAFVANLPLCRECGAPYNWRFSEPDKGFCFECDFWLRRIKLHLENMPGERSLIIDGRAYWSNGMRGKPQRGEMRGFGGAYHLIDLGDGVFHETNDLWAQGEIPLRFRDRLCNNARFVPRARPFQRKLPL